MNSPLPFSAATRALHWQALGERRWDLLVIGGGVTGAGIARDAAARGLQVALVEAGDWAQGTSSRSSRLVHGGLRYLRTGDLGLVWEASAERRRLLDLAPHLVDPLRFLFPVYEHGVGYRTLQAGMWLYDLLAMFRNIARHEMLSPEETALAEPHLRRAGLRGGAFYYDAWADDARLALATASDAQRLGAATVSYAAVTGFVTGAGQVRGARVRDGIGGGEVEVGAALTVNATGPWCDALRTLAEPGVTPRLRPTKGVHVVVARERIGNQHAITFESPVDQRVMFVLPWGRFTYIGTTDTDYDGPPGEVAADRADVEYLLSSANGIFPDAKLVAEDVVSTWAGLRPLLGPEAEVTAGSASREHAIWRDPGGLLNVAGGKLTTFRVMAEEATDTAVGILADETGHRAGKSPITNRPLPGTPDEPWEAFRDRIVARGVGLGLPQNSAEHLVRTHGTAAVDLLAEVQRDPRLGERLAAESPYIHAEVRHAVRDEMAITLEDVLQRRMHLFYELSDGGASIAPAVAEQLAREPGLEWDSATVQRQVAHYRETVRRALAFRDEPPAISR